MNADSDHVWTLTKSEPAASGRAFELASTIRGHESTTATVTWQRDAAGDMIVLVTFRNLQRAYARAMAHRLAAQLWDVIGDLGIAGATDEPLDVTNVEIRDGEGEDEVQVETSGGDAPIMVATFFGDHVAGEML